MASKSSSALGEYRCHRRGHKYLLCAIHDFKTRIVPKSYLSHIAVVHGSKPRLPIVGFNFVSSGLLSKSNVRDADDDDQSPELSANYDAIARRKYFKKITPSRLHHP